MKKANLILLALLILFGFGQYGWSVCEGDFDCDGDVDGSDLAVFAADFGRTDCGPCETLWQQNGSDIYYNDGNVGIGTSSPVWELEVANLTAGDGAESAVTANDARGAIAAYSSTLPDPFAHFGGRVSLFANGETNGLDLRADDSAGDIRFYAGGPWPANERMRITSTGGTRITSYRDDALGSWEEGLYFTNNSNGMGPWSHAGIWADGVSGFNGELVFGVDGDDINNLTGIQEAMRIDKSGNVGIGTTTPTRHLEVWEGGTYMRTYQDTGDPPSLVCDRTSIGGFDYSGAVLASEDYGVRGVHYGDGWAGYFIGDVHVYGYMSKNAGSFVQPHAKDPSKEIEYAFFEGPEHAVFLRGSAQLEEGKSVIELPEHFRIVAAEEGVQVQVTPLEDCNGMFVVNKSRERFSVKELMGGKHNAKFDYFITAVRAGFEDHQPVVENTHFKPKSDETAQEFERLFSKDDMTTKAMRSMLISNGILTEDGKLDMAMVEKKGWTVAEKKSVPDGELRTARKP